MTKANRWVVRIRIRTSRIEGPCDMVKLPLLRVRGLLFTSPDTGRRDQTARSYHRWMWPATSHPDGRSLPSNGADEALHLGLVIVVVHAGSDERVRAARGRIEPRQAGLVDVDVKGTQPVARLGRRFAVLEKRDDPAQLHATIVDAQAGSLHELSTQQRPQCLDAGLDRVDAHSQRVTGGHAQADLARDESLPILEAARIVAYDVGVVVGPGRGVEIEIGRASCRER